MSGPHPAHTPEDFAFRDRDTAVGLSPETVVADPVGPGSLSESPDAVDSAEEFTDVERLASLEPLTLGTESWETKRQAILAGLVAGGSVGLMIDYLLARWMGF